MKVKSILVSILVLSFAFSGVVTAQHGRFMLLQEHQAELGEIWERQEELKMELREKLLELEIFPEQSPQREARWGWAQELENNDFAMKRMQNKRFQNQNSGMPGKRTRVGGSEIWRKNKGHAFSGNHFRNRCQMLETINSLD